MSTRPLALLCLALLCACAPAQVHTSRSAPLVGCSEGNTVLRIINRTGTQVAVYTGSGVGARVTPGETREVCIRGTGSFRPVVRATAGPILAFPSALAGEACWEWRLTAPELRWASDVLDLTPCRTRGADPHAMRRGGEPPLGLSMHSCDYSRPQSYLSIELMLTNPAEALAVVAHELDHLVVMRGLSCEEWKRRAQAKTWQIYVESRAFCAQAREYHRQGKAPTLDAAIERYSFWLASYDFGLMPSGAERSIRAACSLPPLATAATHP